MRRTTPLILSLTLAATLIAAPAFARRGGGHGGRHGKMGGKLSPEMLDHLADRIGLEDDTRAELKELLYDAQERRVEIKAQLEVARLRLRRLLDSPNPDESEVLDQVDKVGQLETAKRKHRIRTLLAVRSQLTPEQRRALKKVRREMVRKRHKRMKRGRHQDRRRGPQDMPAPPDPPLPTDY